MSGPLTLLTLNLAHGRKDGANQLFQSAERIRGNLAEVADFLQQADADLVALQEADGPSRWSGDFDHVALLAEASGYPWHSRAGHARSWLFDYGTALLSRSPFLQVKAVDFEPSPPTMTKGFILGHFAWRPDPASTRELGLDVVSVHLDFSRKGVRERQISELAAALEGRSHPLVILGDFNSDWFAEASVVQELARRRGLQVYRPEAEGLGTYRPNGRRLDWILISHELEFLSHKVYPAVLSDHYPVAAEVTLRGGKQTRRQRCPACTGEGGALAAGRGQPGRNGVVR